METFISIMLFTFSTALTPGPNNLMLMNSGLNFGIRQSMPHYLGICIGFPLMVLIIAIGFGEVFIHYEWVKQTLKIAGSLYMFYLALQIIISQKKQKQNLNKKPWSFLQALLFQWMNPKAWIMAVGIISIFTLSVNYFHNAIYLSLIYFLICFPCIGVWLVFGSFLQRFLKEDKHRRWLNYSMAICLIASIVMIFSE